MTGDGNPSHSSAQTTGEETQKFKVLDSGKKDFPHTQADMDHPTNTSKLSFRFTRV